jgi:lipopolysaccharide biosynthesis protein
MTAARVLAFYLPQFHPIPENERWWGPGFTEWASVARARSLFPGHRQPRVPVELGYYDLRSERSRREQAVLARDHGIEGFCYWHYWSEGARLLEGPFQWALSTGVPDLPFCLAWANASWDRSWRGRPDQVLWPQRYGGPHDWRAHFHALLPAFRDRRYVRIDGRPLFLCASAAGG